MGCYFRDYAGHDVTTLKARNSAKDLLVGWNSEMPTNFYSQYDAGTWRVFRNN